MYILINNKSIHLTLIMLLLHYLQKLINKGQRTRVSDSSNKGLLLNGMVKFVASYHAILLLHL